MTAVVAPPVSTFAERPRVGRVIGSTGIMRFGGMVYDQDVSRLVGPSWLRIVREMTLSPIVGGMLFAVEMLIRRAEWTMSPAPDGGTEAEEIADTVEAMRFDMATSWEDVLAEMMSFLSYGFSVHEIIYKQRLGDDASPTERSAFDDGLIGWGDWSPRPQRTLSRWEYDGHGNLTAFVQGGFAGDPEAVIPISKCIHLVNGSGFRSPEGQSVLLTAFEPWKAIRHIQYYEATGIERELAGYPYMQVPAEILSEPEHAATLDAYKKLVEGIRLNEQAGALIPMVYDENGREMYKLALLTTGGQRAIDTNTVIRRYTSTLVETILAGFLTIGHAQTGSYSLATEKTRLFGMALQAWLDAIAEAVTQQAILPLVRLNGWDTRLAPVLRVGAPDNADLKRDGTYFRDLQSIIGRLDPEDLESLTQHLFALADWPKPEKPLSEPPAPAVPPPDADPAVGEPAPEDDDSKQPPGEED